MGGAPKLRIATPFGCDEFLSVDFGMRSMAAKTRQDDNEFSEVRAPVCDRYSAQAELAFRTLR